MSHAKVVRFSALAFAAGLSAAWGTPALGQGRFFQLPPQAVQVAPGTFDLGLAADVDGRPVQGLMFVHPRRGFAHRPGHNPGGGSGGGGGNGGGSECYAFLANGAKWRTVEPYGLDPNNSSGVSTADIRYWTGVGLITWETPVGEIFGERDDSMVVDGADTQTTDGKNEILFALMSDPNVVAATIVWYTIGPPFTREIVEWDMVLNDDTTAFRWGDAAADPSVMDYLNVFTHEAGHAAGLDHPSDACTEETMYRFTEVSETKKRTLNAGDEAGITALY